METHTNIQKQNKKKLSILVSGKKGKKNTVNSVLGTINEAYHVQTEP